MDYGDRSVTIWSDYLCPFCWVAMPRIDWLAALGVALQWRPYELHPEIPREGISRSELGGARAGRGAQIRTLAEEEGVELDYADFVPNTRLAHEAAEWARAETDAAAYVRYHRALYEAYWEHDRDIGSLDVLAEIAGETGLDADALHDSVESGDRYSAVDHAREQAREHGVTGTPAFLVMRGEAEFLVPGLQDEAFFRRVIERIGGG